jgi:hypothetical protein
MNPTLEVQITAKLDKLDAGLKVAEAKISQSAQTMGKAGEKAAANFGESFAANLPMMMVATAMAKTIGGGLLKAVEDVNAGKSGEQIGLGFAQGIVDGAKSLPVVGVVFGILDELVNGASRYIDKLNESVTKSVEKYISSMQAMRDATENFKKSATEKVEDVADAGDPAAMARRAAERQNKKIDDDVEAAKELGREARRAQRKAQDEKDKASMAGMESEGKTGDIRRALAGEISRDEQIAQEQKASDSARRRAKAAGVEADAKIDALAAAAKLANIQEAEKKIAEASKKAQDDKSAASEKTAADLKTATDKAAAEAVKVADKAAAEAKKAADELVKIAKEKKQAEFAAAMQAQDDIIKGEQTVQKKADKAKVFSEAVSSAGQEFISSGQTALGQFNFAQQGAGSSAIDLAKKQVQSLEKIEAATAEQVRLTKENKGFL